MGKSKANVQLVYLMGTTMLVLCLAPIIDGLLDRRFCSSDGLCNDREDESRFYSDKRVDRLDQDQEQRLLLFNRAERRNDERFDRRDRERIDERRSDRRDERLARHDRSEAANNRRDVDRLDNRQERIFDRQERDADRNINGRSDENRLDDGRRSERVDSHSEDRRLTVEDSRSRNDDRREREERFNERRFRDTRDRMTDERREDIISYSESAERMDRMEDRVDERREREGRSNERLERIERMERELTTEHSRDRAIDEDRRIREEVRDENNRLENRRERNEQRSEHERANRSTRRVSEDRHDSERNNHVDNRVEARNMDKDRYIDTKRIVDQFTANDNNSMPFLWNIVQGALIAFIGFKIMKKNEKNGDWKPSKFTNVFQQRATPVACN